MNTDEHRFKMERVWLSHILGHPPLQGGGWCAVPMPLASAASVGLCSLCVRSSPARRMKKVDSVPGLGDNSGNTVSIR